MNILNTLINNSLGTLGTFKFLDSRPVYAYANGQATEEIVGHKYNCILPDSGFASVSVKILGVPQLESVKSPVDVVFDGLEAVVYTNSRTGRPDVAFKATGVRVVKSN